MKFTFENQSKLKILSDKEIQRIYEEALDILKTKGVHFHSKQAIEFLGDCGAEVDKETLIAKFPENMINDAIKSVPESFELYSYDKKPLTIGGSESHFDPGSATVRMLDFDGSIRKTVGEDLVKIARLTEKLDHIELLSTALTPDDMDVMMADSYRVYLLLKNTTKPFLAGAFSAKGMDAIYSLLLAVAKSKEDLEKYPRSVIDICCTAPLKWTEISCQNIFDATKYKLPIETLSVPIISAAAPATLAGCVLLHTVESLSGITFVQNLNKGNKMVYGGAPMYFDMRHNTTSLNSIEANLISGAYAQMGKYFGIPTHTYSCLSDSKLVDAQAGLESALSGAIASLSGINIISGPGTMEFCNVFSLEKLVIDNDICGMLKRLEKGILVNEDTLAKETILEMGHDGEYLSCDHTLEWYKKEPFYPSKAIDRSMLHTWQAGGSKDTYQNAGDLVKNILSEDWKPILTKTETENLEKVWSQISLTK